MSVDRCQYCGAPMEPTEHRVRFDPQTKETTFRFAAVCPCCQGGDASTLVIAHQGKKTMQPEPFRNRKRKTEGAGG